MAPSRGIRAEELKERARESLLNLLDGIRGKKNLVLQKSLAGPVNLFIKASKLQEHGVEKFFFLENDNLDSSQKHVVFLASAEKPTRPRAIHDQIERLRKKSSIEHSFTIIWTPRRTLLSDKILEELGALGEVTIEVLPLYFLPLDDDVLSLELEESFREMYHDHDRSAVFIAAQALMNIQREHGLFPRIIGKGDNAYGLMELLLRMRHEVMAEDGIADENLMPSDFVESLIIIDRETDFVTPLLTQLTFAGLIDEKFGIHHNEVELDVALIGAAGPAYKSSSQASTDGRASEMGPKRKILLDSADTLFTQLRDANFATVDSKLNKVARRLQSDMQSRHEAKSTSELREFVNKLPGYQAEQQSLKLHIALTEDLIDYTRSDEFRTILEVQQNLADGTDPASQYALIEDLAARGVPLSQILRLICLESCISGGLRQKDLDSHKRLILQAYGYQHLLTLSTLETIGLLQVRASANVLLNSLGGSSGPTENSQTNFSYIRRPMRLIVDEIDEDRPKDISYVYSGCAPLSVRLVQAILQKKYLLTASQAGNLSIGDAPSYNWHGFESITSNIKGKSFSKTQHGQEAAVKARAALQGGTNASSTIKTIIVMFVGGITYAEIAALRFIGAQLFAAKNKRRLLICTTSVISGNKIMEICSESRDFGKS